MAKRYGVKDTDKGMEKLMAKLQRARVSRVKVGILQDNAGKKDEDGVSVLEKAIFNEFGTGEIPERSFVRSTFDDERKPFHKKLKKIAANMLDGADPDNQMELFGEHVKGEIQEKISDGISPANAPSTLKQKGSSKPLIDEGQLRQAISFEVVK